MERCMKDKNSSSTARFVIGIIGIVIFGTLFVISIIFLLFISPLFYVFLPLTVVFAIIFVLSGALLNSGLRRKNVIRRLSRYIAELTSKQEVMPIEDMTSITGFLPMQIKNDMRMLRRWDLSFDLYTDKEEKTLIKGKSSYDQYLETERQREQLMREEFERKSRLKDPDTAVYEEFRAESGKILDKIRAANLLLPGEEISESLYKLEKTTKRIFEHIDNNPEKLPETRKLMNYHLPTTMKLIEKYCEYEGLDYQPQNVAEAKSDIEEALAAANEAFGNFLESLYNIETLDVTTDAKVLTKMFEKDGLTGSSFDIKGDEK
jgi:hypothetical protein